MINSRGHILSSRTLTPTAFWLLVDGIYIWEFLIALGFELNVIRGRRPHRWTIWIYSLTRLATLAYVAVNIFSLVAPTPINCQTSINTQFTLSYLIEAASSLMIVLRVIAIWDKKRTIVAIATGIWWTNIGFLIHGIVRFYSSWDWEIEDCALYLEGVKLSTVSAFVTDITLVLMMLFGLYRMRRQGSLMALGRLLWNQGVVWLLVAVIAELVPTVFICLDLKEMAAPLKIAFLMPWVITISIASTRMYRSLSDFLSSGGFHVSPQKVLPKSDQTSLENNGTPTSPVFVAGVQVSVHKSHEQPDTPQKNDSGTDITGQLNVKPHELTVGLAGDHDSAESGSINASCEV